MSVRSLCSAARRAAALLRFTAAAFSLSIFAFACSGDDANGGGGEVDTTICNVGSKCPNEPPESDADKADCKKALEGPCASQFRTFDKCQKANEQCGTDGKADINATAMRCKTELDDYVKCTLPGSQTKDAGTSG